MNIRKYNNYSAAEYVLSEHAHSFYEHAGERSGYIIGRTKDYCAIALINGPLTMEIHKKIMEDAKAFGLKRPVHIYATVNAGPNGSRSYDFHQFSYEHEHDFKFEGDRLIHWCHLIVYL